MSALSPAPCDRLVKSLGMGGSSFDGERAAAAQATIKLPARRTRTQ